MPGQLLLIYVLSGEGIVCVMLPVLLQWQAIGQHSKPCSTAAGMLRQAVESEPCQGLDGKLPCAGARKRP